MTVTFNKNWALSAFAILVLLAGCQKSTDRASSFDAEKVYTGADGRAYRLERLEKKPGGYAWINKTMLRYYPHGFYEVESQDDAYFYVRQYVPVKVNPPAESAAAAAAVSPLASEAFSWQAFDGGLPREGQWRDNFAVADMNGDGIPDLVFAPARKTLTRPAIFLGDGKGKWKLWTQAQYPKLPYDYGGAAVADFNGDGKADVALGMHLLGIAALAGDGKGRFSDYGNGLPRSKNHEPPIFSSRKVLAYDWNGDGRQALLALNERMGADPVNGLRDGVAVFLSDKGAWTPAASDAPLQHAVLMATDASAKKLALVDAPSSAGSLRISERTAGAWKIREIAEFPKDAMLTALAIADDKGGAETSLYAVAYRRYAQSSWWAHIDLIREQDGHWQRVPLIAQPAAAGILALAFGKLRPGAFRDIVTVDENGETGIFREADAGAYTRDRGLPPPPWRAGCQGYGLQAVDLDKDGIAEVVVAFAGEGTPLTKAFECVSGGGIQAFKISSAGH